MPFTTPPVRIQFSPDRITFSAADRTWSHPPTAWVRDRDGKVVGVGEAPVAGAHRVSLFANDGANDRGRLLSEFLLQATLPALEGVWLKVKPKVTVAGADMMAPLMGGYQRTLLKDAVSTFAMSVVFE